MPSNHLILCHPRLLLPSIFPSNRVFSNESALRIRWPKYWSFSFSVSPSNEYSGQISFRIDWFYLLPVQGTLKSLLQHHSSKASILHIKSNTFDMKYVTSLDWPGLGLRYWVNDGSNLGLWIGRQGFGEGNGNPLQYSCLENAVDRGAWWAP